VRGVPLCVIPFWTSYPPFGRCPPNRIKPKVIRRKGPWRSLEAVEFATLAWVDWFNMRRLLGPIGDVPPAEFEAQYYAHAAVA